MLICYHLSVVNEEGAHLTILMIACQRKIVHPIDKIILLH